MEHARCAQCRNPIRGRQQAVHLASAGRDFHEDCWRALQVHVQDRYLESVSALGVPALLRPYSRAHPLDWSAFELVSQGG